MRNPIFDGFSEMTASEDLKQRLYTAAAEPISQGAALPQRRIPVRFAVILTAILAVVLVGFTNANHIERLFQILFGGSVHLAEFEYNMIGESATDQGFQLEIVSAVRDSENLYLIAEFTDLEGDRLSDDLYIDYGGVDGIAKHLGEDVASMSGIKADLLEYDDSRKTAVFGVHATGNFEAEEAVYTLTGFATGKTSVNTDAPEISLYEIAGNATDAFQPFDRSAYDFVSMSGGSAYLRIKAGKSPLDEIEECLTRDSMDISIPGYSRETISNVAYKDGRLHILFKTSQPGTGNNTWTALQHSGTKEGLRSLYSLSYDVDGVFYQESVYELEHLESLEDYVLHVEGDYYENAYEGKWQVRFDAPQEVTSVDLPVDGAPAPIKKVTVTPLSVVILNSGETSRDGFAVTLIYNDGTRKPLTGSDMYTYENGDQEWHYANAFLFQEIVAVEINGVGLDFPHDLLIASYEDAAKLDLEVSDFQISE